MGNWNITIQGTGAHHNASYPDDANRMAADFVKRLKDAGHNVTSATFTHGGADDMTDAEQYLADRDPLAKQPT